MQIKRAEAALFVFEDDMIIYVENAQKFREILGFLTSDFTNFGGYKINIHGNQLHFQNAVYYPPHKLLS